VREEKDEVIWVMNNLVVTDLPNQIEGEQESAHNPFRLSRRLSADLLR
jgi:hypothetical protein